MSAVPLVVHRRPAARPPARVVVLGATGFVAGDLVRRLGDERIPVLALSAKDVDLCAPGSVERLQAVICADDAVVFVSALTPDRGRDIATLMRNLAMAHHVTDALAKNPCAHVVYVSSDAVYEDAAEHVTETTCAAPASLHGVMHVTRERLLRHALGPAGIPLMVLRPSLLYGARDTHNGYGPNRFMRTARTEKTIALFGGGEEQRDHVAVGDLSLLIMLALAHRSEGVLNVATGRSSSFLEVAEAVQQCAAQPVTIETRPRSGPVTHRHFDARATTAAFPAFRYTPSSDGLAAAWNELERADGR
jgi:nucleoside-diphosphate-sugar epimerase